MSSIYLEQRYTDTLAEMAAQGLIEGDELPSLQELMQTIKDTVDDEQLSFPGFEQFFEWWDVTTAYDQMDEETSVEHHKPALEIAFAALLREGFFVVDFKSTYEAKVAELIQSGTVAQGELPDFDAITAEIKVAVLIDQDRFWSFAEFFDFYEKAVAVAAENFSLTLEHQKPALEVLYWSLVCEDAL
ncbi:hypothetical protein [Stutzerimonas stutzeri]|uniref:hypothetical protein n=1 Tax=Stutzerimonas stutzeri TaxID=316 RepID=UPI0015E36216|nr:hypothetical protein [Stutzerimonas stutzeri]MBA1280452.1 hypothetical protein [Stutzerimonas stutzeri]